MIEKGYSIFWINLQEPSELHIELFATIESRRRWMRRYRHRVDAWRPIWNGVDAPIRVIDKAGYGGKVE